MTVRTVGVEEEYLLVDPGTWHPRAVSHVALAIGDDAQLTAELQREQLESATRPCATTAEIADELRRARAGAAQAARAAGAELAALATSPLAVDPTLSPSERYREMGRRFGLTVSEALWKARPVIGGNVGGITTQIEDRVTGHLVDSPHVCSERALEILADPAEARAMARRGKEHVRRRFLTPRLVRDWLALMHRLDGEDVVLDVHGES